MRVTGSTAARVAEVLGIDRRQVYRLRQSGLTFAQADELATRVDLHPSSVWGELWWSVELDVDEGWLLIND